jgi:hypothetical protein
MRRQAANSPRRTWTPAAREQGDRTGGRGLTSKTKRDKNPFIFQPIMKIFGARRPAAMSTMKSP